MILTGQCVTELGRTGAGFSVSNGSRNDKLNCFIVLVKSVILLVSSSRVSDVPMTTPKKKTE